MKWFTHLYKFMLVLYLFGQGFCFASEGEDRVSVMTWNVLGEYSDTFQQLFPLQERSKTWYRERLLGILEKITEIKADIICLQEVSAPLYQDLKRSTLPYHYWYSGKGPTSGILVGYSKAVFYQTIWDSIDLDTHHGGKALCAILQKKQTNQKYAIGCVHIARALEETTRSLVDGNFVVVDNYQQGEMQVQKLLTHIAQFSEDQQYPTIIAGDFNTPYLEMERLAHSCRMSLFDHLSFTFTTRGGWFQAIDHILYNNVRLVEKNSFVFNRSNPYKANFKKKGYRQQLGRHGFVPLIYGSTWSDHAPVVATFVSSLAVPIERLSTESYVAKSSQQSPGLSSSQSDLSSMDLSFERPGSASSWNSSPRRDGPSLRQRLANAISVDELVLLTDDPEMSQGPGGGLQMNSSPKGSVAEPKSKPMSFKEAVQSSISRVRK